MPYEIKPIPAHESTEALDTVPELLSAMAFWYARMAAEFPASGKKYRQQVIQRAYEIEAYVSNQQGV